MVREADAETDPLRAFQLTKPAYVEAYKGGIAFCMIPAEYGGGGLSTVELVVAAEEICAVDPGFACTVLVNGLALLPVWYWGTEEQKDRVLRAATSIRAGSSSPATPPANLPARQAGRRTSTIPSPTPRGSAS